MKNGGWFLIVSPVVVLMPAVHGFAGAGTGDSDGNGITDLHDYGSFYGCFADPLEGPLDPTCKPFDFDSDQDVDLIDFGMFQNAFGAPPCELRWDDRFDADGMNSVVHALTTFGTGDETALFAAGEFGMAGDVAASRIARWDGVDWSPLGVGLGNQARAAIHHVNESGPGLYVGGNFNMAGGMSANIAKWDGTGWSAAATGVNSFVYSFGEFDEGGRTRLFAGGSFTQIGGVQANSIARWDGVQWSALGDGIRLDSVLPPRVRAMTVYDDGTGPTLVVGGEFSMAGGVAAANLAAWNGISWSPLGGGTTNMVRALCVFDDGTGPALYVGGSFSRAGNVLVQGIARWDGASWTALADGVAGGVFALIVFDDGTGPALYAGGYFIIGTPQGLIDHIAKWDGKAWSPLGSGMNNSVNAMAVFEDKAGRSLYAGGEFSRAGGLSSRRIAQWHRPKQPCPE